MQHGKKEGFVRDSGDISTFRSYVFSFTAIKVQSENLSTDSHISLKPSVSILIPARDEENVIERLLQRLTELTYPKTNLKLS